MDAKDLQIVKALLKNCRTTYREMAEILGLSINAVYKRVQNMLDSGLILGFTAKPSLIALNGLEILIFGRSKAKNLDELSHKLGEDESVYFVGLAAGNLIYIGGYLRDISELHNYTTIITQKGQLNELTTCIKKVPYRISPEKLTKLDYEILKALKDDARRAVSDLAEEVRVSAKTIRKRIKKMINYNLVEFSINFAPQMTTSNFHIHLRKKGDYNKKYKRIESKYSDHILYLQQFSNIPNFIMMTALTNTNQEAAELHNSLQGEGFEGLEHNILYNGYFFGTWRDELYRKTLAI